MRKYKGKKWGQLTEQEQYDVKKEIINIVGADGNRVKKGECIIDFIDNISICGYVNETFDDTEIIIDDNEIFYDSTE